MPFKSEFSDSGERVGGRADCLGPVSQAALGADTTEGFGLWFPLERKRNSLEATKEQLIHNSSNLKKA